MLLACGCHESRCSCFVRPPSVVSPISSVHFAVPQKVLRPPGLATRLDSPWLVLQVGSTSCYLLRGLGGRGAGGAIGEFNQIKLDIPLEFFALDNSVNNKLRKIFFL